MCNSSLPDQVECYAGVILETCDISAADINMLKTVLYNAKSSSYVDWKCPLGELLSVY